MKIAEFIAHLRSLDVELSAHGERLRCNAPKGVITATLRQELAERKSEILAQLRQEQTNYSPADISLKPIDREGELPLYFSQELIWFFEQLQPNTPAYNIPTAIRLQGELNVAALEHSFNEIVRRHEVLRSTCATVNGKPVLAIAKELTVNLLIVDLRELPEIEQEKEVQRIATEEARSPFDLARGPMLRVSLLWLHQQEYVLLLNLHHFVADGWSMPILFRELSALYEAFDNGRPSPLPELEIQYVDFAHWQKQKMQTSVLENQLNYWKKQLAGSSCVLELPTDRPRPAIQTYEGASHSFVLPEALSESIKAYARREGVTLFMTLLAAFGTLLYRYTHQQDLIVATAVSHRHRLEIEGLIGSFANNILLPTDVSGNPTFQELLHRVREVAIGAYGNQDLPFEKLVEELQPQRDLSRHPLFQVMFILHQQTVQETLKLPGITWSQIPNSMGISQWDLELGMSDGQETLSGSFHYNSNLFDATYYEIDPNKEFTRISIGKAIDNIQVYILDKYLQPVPIGIIGEIHIGGDGLARGYLNRPELTQEKFIPSPFNPSQRLYKTGDLARYLSDENIEFLGRIDNQVKIRGYRIESGEIESVLTQHPHVKESIVLATQKIPDDKFLVAYIVPTQEQVPSLEELRSFLKQKLPHYMIPSALVPIEAIPLTPNGKVDRLALAKLNIGRQTSARNYVAPRNSTEKKLVEIWSKVLWLEQKIGIHDNFFDLGGHSLLSVRLIAEIEKEFNQKVPLTALFKLGTITELANIIDQETENNLNLETCKHPDLSQEIYDKLLAYTAGWQGKRVRPNSLIIGMNTTGTKQPLFWCLQGYRELFQLAKYMGEDQPVYGMRSGHLIMEHTPENIQALAANYVSEILAIQSDYPYLLGGNCQSAWIIFEVAQQLINKGKTITLLCQMEQFVTQSYPGRVALLFGRESRFNPYQKFCTPELGYRKFYSGGCSVNIISGGHGHFFKEPNIQVLAETLSIEIEKAKLESVDFEQDIKQYQILPSQAYQAQITTQSTLLIAKEGETIVISVIVKNISSVDWKSTEYSGIKLGNHWLDEREEVFQWADGRVDLPKGLQPGEEIELDLSVTFPTKIGNYFLELDLVEEGITWFQDKDSTTTKIPVEVIHSEQTSTQNNSDFYHQEGNYCFKKGDMESAIINYQKAIKLNPNQPAEVYQKLGDAYSQQEKFSESIVFCNKALELDSNNAQLYFMLGKVQEKQDKLTEAAASYQKAIDLQPDSIWFYENLGQVLNKLGQFEAAIEVYNNAIKLDSHNANIYVQLGLAQIRKVDFSGAITSYNQALQLHPENSGIYAQLGNAYSRQGNFAEAISCYKKAIELNPRHIFAYISWGNTLKQQGNIEEAIALYQKAIEIEPNHPAGYNNLANTQRQQKDFEAAILSYRLSLELNPQQFHIYTALGNTLFQVSKLEEAITAYTEAIQLDAKHPGVYVALGNAQRRSGQIEQAITSYQKAIELNPKQPFGVYKNLGDALSKQGEIEKAVEAYTEALKIQPNNKIISQCLEQIKTS